MNASEVSRNSSTLRLRETRPPFRLQEIPLPLRHPRSKRYTLLIIWEMSREWECHICYQLKCRPIKQPFRQNKGLIRRTTLKGETGSFGADMSCAFVSLYNCFWLKSDGPPILWRWLLLHLVVSQRCVTHTHMGNWRKGWQDQALGRQSPGVNFIDILQAALMAANYLRHKCANLKCQCRKAACITFICYIY